MGLKNYKVAKDEAFVWMVMQKYDNILLKMKVSKRKAIICGIIVNRKTTSDDRNGTKSDINGKKRAGEV